MKGLPEEEIRRVRRGEASEPNHVALVRFTGRVLETKGFVDDLPGEGIHTYSRTAASGSLRIAFSSGSPGTCGARYPSACAASIR